MTIDELEQTDKPTPPNEPFKSCVTCTFGDNVIEKDRTWRPEGGREEPMRMCFNFMEYVPARASFYCSMWRRK